MATSSLSNLVDAAPDQVGMSASRLANMTRLVQRYVDDGKYAGAISLVARRDRVVYLETYGMMDVEAGKVMQEDTIFRLASMTKPIVSVALMTLYEEGHFQLDTPVSEFIPAFKDVQVFAGGTADSYQTRSPARPITVADLLRHTAGFESLGGTSPVAELYSRASVDSASTSRMAHTSTLADHVAALAKLPLVGDPGAQFTYNTATNVAGRLCELISGQTLDAFLSTRILQPLGMDDTAFHVPLAKRARFAACYLQANEGDTRYRRRDPAEDAQYDDDATFFAASGGLTSTVADYLRFARMLARGGELDGERILGPRTLRFIAMNHLPDGKDLVAMGYPGAGSPMDGTGFGLGFAVRLDPVRGQLLGTPGEYYWNGAYSTMFFVAPAEDLIVIMMTQLRTSSPYPMGRELRIAAYQAITD